MCDLYRNSLWNGHPSQVKTSRSPPLGTCDPSLNLSFPGPVILGKQNGWYNPNAFILPAAGTFGNLGRGTFTGPGMADLDVSLFKGTALTEKVALQFRA